MFHNMSYANRGYEAAIGKVVPCSVFLPAAERPTTERDRQRGSRRRTFDDDEDLTPSMRHATLRGTRTPAHRRGREQHGFGPHKPTGRTAVGPGDL